MPAENPLFTQLKKKILKRLENDLAPQLRYHSVAHTRDDVLPRVAYLAGKYELTEDDQLALQLAALFHDTGYLLRYQQNEVLGAQLALTEMDQAGISGQIINLVQRLIMATVMPQQPTSLLEQIICDADLDSLGRDDFIQTSLHLREELTYYQQHIPLKDWWCRQYDFMTSHSYFTEIAKQQRQEGKQLNIKKLVTLIADPEADVPNVS